MPINLDSSINVKVQADTAEFDQAFAKMNATAINFGRVFSSSLKQAVREGNSFESMLRTVGMRLADIALKRAVVPLENVTSNLFNAVLGNIGTSATNAILGGMKPSNIVPMAKGGVVSSPTFFGLGNKTGLMREARPEAVLPLERGHDGSLGVRASGSRPSTQIVFNVNASDAQSFRRSEGQISAMLARATQRGQRHL